MATYRNDAGEWEIRAEHLDLVQTTKVGKRPPRVKRQSFRDLRALIASARKAITKGRAHYQLDGNAAVGPGADAPPVALAAVRKQLSAVPRSMGADLREVVSDPGDFSGGLLFVDGDLDVPGDWNASEYAAVVVTGNCNVDGLLVQLETEPIVVVLGDLSATRLFCTGRLFVGRDLTVTDLAYFEGDHGEAVVARNAQIGTTVLHVLSLEVGGRLKTRCAVAHEPELFHVKPRPPNVIGVPSPALRDHFMDAALDDSRTSFVHFRDLEAMMLLGLPITR